MVEQEGYSLKLNPKRDKAIPVISCAYNLKTGNL